MTTPEEKIQIIGNESNSIIEVEAGNNTTAPNITKEKNVAPETDSNVTSQRSNDEVATNDGAVIETLDIALHNKVDLAGENLSGSDRADYYEARSQGKSDAQEELDGLNKGEQQ